MHSKSGKRLSLWKEKWNFVKAVYRRCSYSLIHVENSLGRTSSTKSKCETPLNFSQRRISKVFIFILYPLLYLGCCCFVLLSFLLRLVWFLAELDVQSRTCLEDMVITVPHSAPFSSTLTILHLNILLLFPLCSLCFSLQRSCSWPSCDWRENRLSYWYQ